MLHRMKTMTKTADVEQDCQRDGGKGRWIGWAVYLIGAASLLILWFIAGSVMVSYLFGGWILLGMTVLWLTEDSLEY